MLASLEMQNISCKKMDKFLTFLAPFDSQSALRMWKKKKNAVSYWMGDSICACEFAAFVGYY